jgi:hypothetical protein
MTGRVQGDLNTIYGEFFSEGGNLEASVRSKPSLQDLSGRLGRKNTATAPACMIGVSVSNDRFFHGLPGVHIKIPKRAIDSGWRAFDGIMTLNHPWCLPGESDVVIG